ncbi:hypothetical protein TWF788_004040 [Orbilia oligospora]|uniref:Fucose-specific lectin n=1 Tax=Orbilia oligospora TaxID=2813651 RepID=A0A7C8P3X9_ORBOL|nr:hypothetical protein TWF788_004040 [Orbilia oligospora]
MSTFPISVKVDNKNLIISWTNQPNVQYLDIQLQRTIKDNAKPYYTKRVSCDVDTLILTPSDYVAGREIYALVPRYVFAYPVLAPASVDAHVDFELYKAWTDGTINDFGVKLGKNASLAPWSNTWGSVGYSFNGVIWTGQNGAIASTGDNRPCNHVVLNIGDATVASGGTGGGSVCVVNHWFASTKEDCWDAWWVSPDGHLSHVQCLDAPQTFPKTWGRTKIWHDDYRVSALTAESLRMYGENPYKNTSDCIIWFVAKHGTGQKGTLYQSSRIDGEVSTAEVQQDDSECFVAPGSGISSEKIMDTGPTLAWITPDGAVMSLQQDFKVENDPVFNRIAPPGSAALESTVCLSADFVWWFGPNYELMVAHITNRKDAAEWKDVTWTIWEVLPAGVGRKGKDSIVRCDDLMTIWFAGADDVPHSIFLDDTNQFDMWD